MVNPSFSAKILLVEDDDLLRELLRELLQEEGMSVIDVADGRQAQVVIESESVSAIVCDLFLPGMDGIAFLKWLQQNDSSIPVIVLSANTSPGLEQQLHQLNVTDHFTKPLSSDGIRRLTERLGQLING